ncbi:MAG: thioredoxin family protein [Spirochaetia bacterium]|jgi:thiol-disulfide isomerase/thioredoxin
MVLEGTLFRLIFAAVLVAALAGTYRVVTAFVLARARRIGSGLSQFTPGTPGVVFFTTPDCVACKAAQKPALKELADRLSGRVQVIEVDALDNAVLAREWSVLSVPTTFVLDRNGRPRQVNHGYASTEKLFGQIAALGQI